MLTLTARWVTLSMEGDEPMLLAAVIALHVFVSALALSGSTPYIPAAR